MEWEDLPLQAQRETIKCAKAGRRHPDAAVAAAAGEWAAWVVEENLIWFILSCAFDLVLMSVTFGLAGTGESFLRRRRARLILRADASNGA